MRTRMSKDNGKINTIYWFYAGHIDWKNSIAVCASMDFGKGLGRSEPWGNSRWSRWRNDRKERQEFEFKFKTFRKETTRKIFSTRSQRIEISYNNIDKHGIPRGLGHGQYRIMNGALLDSLYGSPSVLSLGHSATLVHNTQVPVLWLLHVCKHEVSDY